MTQVVVADLLTGRRIVDLPFARLRWSNVRNGRGTITCTLNLFDADVRALDIRNITTPKKTLMGVLENDIFMQIGYIERRRYSKSTGTLEITAPGILKYFGQRTIIPATALSTPLTSEATDSTWSGFDLGTIAKKIVQQSTTLPNGNLPLVFETDRAGSHERTYKGLDLKDIESALLDLSRVENGPDFRFVGRWAADRQSIEILFQTGTEAEPRLRSRSVHEWDYTVGEPSLDSLVADDSAEDMVTDVWALGGRRSDTVMFSHAQNDALLAAGYPRFEDVDGGYATVEEQPTLDAHAVGSLADNGSAIELMPFRVLADERVGQFFPGDDCRVHVAGDAFYPEGLYERVIQSISGDEQGRWIGVETLEASVGA